MVEKSSSVRIMSAASLATSVPCRPMAMPISAFFSAGASFTPSPVMATMSPRACSALTIFILWSGFVRAKMVVFWIACVRSASDMASSSSPRRTGRTLTWPGVCSRAVGMAMPSCLPMATAVVSASPVIMITLTPPRISFLIERPTPGRGGSLMPTRPAKVSPLYRSSWPCDTGLGLFSPVGVPPRWVGMPARFLPDLETAPLAKANTRRPCDAI